MPLCDTAKLMVCVVKYVICMHACTYTYVNKKGCCSYPSPYKHLDWWVRNVFPKPCNIWISIYMNSLPTEYQVTIKNENWNYTLSLKKLLKHNLSNDTINT